MYRKITLEDEQICTAGGISGIRTCKDSKETYFARPLMIVRGSSSPTSIFSTYKLRKVDEKCNIFNVAYLKKFELFTPKIPVCVGMWFGR